MKTYFNSPNTWALGHCFEWQIAVFEKLLKLVSPLRRAKQLYFNSSFSNLITSEISRSANVRCGNSRRRLASRRQKSAKNVSIRLRRSVLGSPREGERRGRSPAEIEAQDRNQTRAGGNFDQERELGCDDGRRRRRRSNDVHQVQGQGGRLVPSAGHCPAQKLPETGRLEPSATSAATTAASPPPSFSGAAHATATAAAKPRTANSK